MINKIILILPASANTPDYNNLFTRFLAILLI